MQTTKNTARYVAKMGFRAMLQHAQYKGTALGGCWQWAFDADGWRITVQDAHGKKYSFKPAKSWL